MITGNRKNRKILSEINVINLVDVMLCVLIIFILVAPLMEHGIDIRLPTSSPSKIQSTEDSLTVSISPPGKIFLNNQRVTLDELRQQLERIGRLNPEAPLVLRAEDSLDYGVVVKVLDEIRNSGLTRIGIATRPVSR